MNDFQTGTIKYFSSSENRLKAFRKSKLYLEYVFDVHLYMSDKMNLRNEVNIMIGEAEKVTNPANYQIPEQSAVARFLFINYPCLDHQLIARAIVTGYPIKKLNKEVNFLLHK